MSSASDSAVLTASDRCCREGGGPRPMWLGRALFLRAESNRSALVSLDGHNHFPLIHEDEVEASHLAVRDRNSPGTCAIGQHAVSAHKSGREDYAVIALGFDP